MMFEGAYRRRLEGDLVRWQAQGLMPPAAGDAIRRSLGPAPASVNVATVVGLVGGLLIAAAFLAFVAANWTVIPRPARFGILLGGIAGAYGLAAWFDRTERTFLADSAVSVGCIVFGAAIALVGQMYHLGGDFAGALLLWAAAALAAAALTGSRGAFAVALGVACFWSGFRIGDEGQSPHVPFIAFWLVAAVFPVVWDSVVARHLAAVALLGWWIAAALGLADAFHLGDPAFAIAAGLALMVGAGFFLSAVGPQPLRAFGLVLATYGSFGFALVVAWSVADVLRDRSGRGLPMWLEACALIGFAASLAAAALIRQPGPALAALSIGLGLAVASGWTRAPGGAESFVTYAASLVAMVALVASGMLDDVRARIAAGWIGLACTIAAITWAVQGSLLERSMFLAAAGLVAIALANLLARLLPRGSVS